jgi:hypothetical protein
MSVLRTRIAEDVAERARRLVDAARWQATVDLAQGRAAEPQDWWEVRLGAGPQRRQLETGSLGELVGGDTPPELPPGPGPVDPRIALAVAAYVRAGLIAEARAIAAAGGLPHPDRYVARLVERRAIAVAASGRRIRPQVRRKRAG